MVVYKPPISGSARPKKVKDFEEEIEELDDDKENLLAPVMEIEEYEQEEFEKLPLDEVYTVEVTSYNIVKSRYQDKDGNDKYDLKWTLTVVEPEEYVGRQLVYWTPARLSRNKTTGKPNKTLKFLECLMNGEGVDKNKKYSANDFLNKYCRVTITEKKLDDGRDWQTVDAVIPYRDRKPLKKSVTRSQNRR